MMMYTNLKGLVEKGEPDVLKHRRSSFNYRREEMTLRTLWSQMKTRKYVKKSKQTLSDVSLERSERELNLKEKVVVVYGEATHHRMPLPLALILSL